MAAAKAGERDEQIARSRAADEEVDYHQRKRSHGGGSEYDGEQP